MGSKINEQNSEPISKKSLVILMIIGLIIYLVMTGIFVYMYVDLNLSPNKNNNGLAVALILVFIVTYGSIVNAIATCVFVAGLIVAIVKRSRGLSDAWGFTFMFLMALPILTEVLFVLALQ